MLLLFPRNTFFIKWKEKVTRSMLSSLIDKLPSKTITSRKSVLSY